MRSTPTLLLLLGVLFGRSAWAQDATRTVEFTENKGQWDARARYGAHVAAGAWLFAETTGLTYALTSGLPDHAAHQAGAAKATATLPAITQLPSHGLRVTFVRPESSASLLAEDAAAGRRHYLRGPAPTRWAADVRSFRQLRYRALWPGTDVVLHENAAHQLEYDLLLAPGADPARARLRYQGADGLRLDPATGHLLVKTSAGLLTEQRPQAWQTNATGQRQPVACTFALEGTEVSFRLGRYDHSRPLVIDPTVLFASYTGSAVENWGFAATPDAQGNLYTAGVVFEAGYPITTGAYQTDFSRNTDIAIMKFNTGANGPGARAWATYLGGNGFDFPHSLLVNGRGELLVLGTTSSTDFPTSAGALARSFRGGPAVAPFSGSSPFVLTNGADLVLSRLSASGGGLRAGTYLGGSGTDGLLDAAAPTPRLRHNYGDAFRGDLALDGQGNVYVASVTSSTDFPGAAGSYHGGPSDGLVTCLDSSLSRTRWTTLLGGTGADAAYSLQREEPAGGLLVAGGTTSAALPGTTGGYRPTASGDVDGYVARLTAVGVLTQATYLGTSGYDQAFFVRTAPGGVLVLGQTLGQSWPGVDTARYHNLRAPQILRGQQFIQKLAPDLRTAGYAVVFGSGRGTTDFSPTAFGVDCYGRIALAGWGGGLDPNNGSVLGLPTTPNALQRGTDGLDFYLMQLSDGARQLDYATFFGTSADDHTDGGTSRFDTQNVLYQALCACDQAGGTSIPIPPGATTYLGSNGAPKCNNAAFKFAFLANASPAGADTISVCARGRAVPLGGSPEGGVWTGDGVTGSVASGFSFMPDTTLVGSHVLTYNSPSAANGCAGTSTRRITVLPQGTARLTTTETEFCLRPGVVLASVPLRGRPAGGHFTGLGVVLGTVPGTASFNPQLAGKGVHIITYEVAGGRCPATASVRMTVKGLATLPPQEPMRLCANDPPRPLGGSPPGGVWTGTGVSGGIGSFVFTPSTALIGGPYTLHYTFTADPGCDPITDSVQVVVLPAGASARVPADTALCLSPRSFRLRGGTPTGGTWSGPGVSGSVATGFTFTPSALSVGDLTLIYTGPPGNTPACPGRAGRRVTVNSDGQALVTAPDTIVCAVAGPQPLSAVPAGGTWSGPGVSGSVATGFTFTPTPAMAGVQVLGYIGPAPTDPADCPVAGRLRIQVLPLPLVLMAPITPINFCLTAPPHGVVLTAGPPGGVFGGPGVVGNRFNPADAGPGHHTLTYTWDFPSIRCPVVATQTVDVVLVATAQLRPDTVLCAGQGPFQVRALPAGGTWSGPGVTPAGLFTPPTVAGTTELYYTLADGCPSPPYRITVPPRPTFLASWTATACATTALAPRTLRFEATGPAAAEVRWDFGDGTPPATGAVVEHSYATAGRFQPQAALPDAPATLGPCQGTFALPPVAVQAAEIPNIITPNGDGLNDVFTLKVGGCLGRLQVFSRWGQRVFDSPAYHNEWDGQGLGPGIYYYLLDGAGGTARLKGWVELVR
jgi:hypothetical protein